MGRRLIDISGKRYGSLTVVERINNDGSGGSKWVCRCDCGAEVVVYGANLRAGRTKSCGCRQKHDDLTGQRFGKLVAIERINQPNNRHEMWLCKCDCGNVTKTRKSRLLSGHTSSCGCGHRKTPNLVGRRFGRLLVIDDLGSEDGRLYCKCLCECGSVFKTRTDGLVGGGTKSCGCARKEARPKRAKKQNVKKQTVSDERLYSVWTNMKTRCNNERNAMYPYYGGRGIKICGEWLDYSAFKKWAYANGYDENAPRGECTLDRVNVNGNYEPSNCRWISTKEQSNNRRSNVLISFSGITQNASQWAAEIGANACTILARKRRGWTDEECLFGRDK